MKFLKIVILTIALVLLMGGEVMANDFIQIPSYLADNNNIVNAEISPLAACDGACMDWCEHYDECCNYENCMGSCETCQTGCQVSCQSSCQESCQSGQAPTNPAQNAVLTISDISKTYFKAVVSGINNPTGIMLHVKFYINSVFDGGVFTSESDSIEHTYSGLSAGSSYSVKVEIINNSTGAILKTLTRTVTTDEPDPLPKLPNPSLDTSKTIKTANSITVTINFQSGVNRHYFRINGGTTIDGGVIATHMFTNLTPNTQYYIEIKVGGSGYEDSDWVGYYATTLVTVEWEWWYPKDDIRRFTLDRDEWLAFCNKINEVRVAKGLSAYSFTTSSTYIGKDKPFYAWIWLEAANAINAINGQVAAACLNVKSWSESQGNDSIIYPWYWDNLKSALNNAV